MDHASVNLEQDGTMFIGEEFADAADWVNHLAPMREISDWWRRVSPIDGAKAHAHRNSLQTSIKRRQYSVLGGYVSRALRTEEELSRVCFGFVPLVIEAVWSQHGELSLQKLTEGLSLLEMTRRPREALLWQLTQKDAQGLRLLLEELDIPSEVLHAACEQARGTGNTEALALLLERQHQQAPTGFDKDFDL